MVVCCCSRERGVEQKAYSLDDYLAPDLTPRPRLGILACGNPTVDRTIECTAGMLKKAGFVVGGETAGRDAAFKENALKVAMKLGRVKSTTPGGAALNTARVAAGRFGTVTAFLGCVGMDANGDFLRKAAADVGVRWLVPPVPQVATGICAVLVEVNSRERSLVVVPGAARSLEQSHVENVEVTAAMQEAAILYATSFVLSTPPRAAVVRQLAEVAETTGATFALNLSSVGLQKAVAPEIVTLLPKTKLLFGNANEFQAFADACGRKADMGSALHTEAELVAKIHPDGFFVMTQGAEPTIITGPSLDAPLRFSVPSIAKEEIVDTNCAGDSFVAGFLAAYERIACVQGRAALVVNTECLARCVSQGHAAASQTLRMRGC